MWPRLGPDVVVVAPCGYGLTDALEQAQGLVDQGKLPAGAPVWAVDADAAFVRPGPRLVDGVEALAFICHPRAAPPRPDVAAYAGTTASGTNPSRPPVSPARRSRPPRVTPPGT